jgi:rubrerythrin
MHVPKIKSRERQLIERYDKVFWVCMSCQSRMKRGFMIPEWEMGDTVPVRCPLCLSPDVREDGTEPLMFRQHQPRRT